jgi:hypothetical protein
MKKSERDPYKAAYYKFREQEYKDAVAKWDIDEEAEDMVGAPPHYRSHPSGIECIEVTRHMGFNLGNAIKYIWRADLKHDAIEDLRKAIWYLEDELNKREDNND